MPKVVWTRQARGDLRAIHDYIARDAPYTAAAFTKRLMQSVRILRGTPHIGAVVPECRRDDIRELVRRNYRVIYRAEIEQVSILSVYHAARILDDGSFDTNA